MTFVIKNCCIHTNNSEENFTYELESLSWQYLWRQYFNRQMRRIWPF